VTHDQVEAMTMGQRIAVMKDGLLQQCDVPETVYRQPANKFVAGFIGSPPMNFLDATISVSGSDVFVDAGDFKLPLNSTAKGQVKNGQKVTLGIRPEAIVDPALPGPVKAGPHNTVEMKVDVLEPLGHEYTAYLNVGKHNLIATLDPATKVKENAVSQFLVDVDQIHVFDGESEEAIR
jgi:multiple sugar transport system ATP-binding protein